MFKVLEELLDEVLVGVLVFGGCACLPPRPFSSVSLFSSQDFPAPAGAGWAGSAGACRSFRSFRGFRGFRSFRTVRSFKSFR